MISKRIRSPPFSSFPFFLPPSPIPSPNFRSSPLILSRRPFFSPHAHPYPTLRLPIRPIFKMTSSTPAPMKNPEDKILSALSSLSSQPRLTVADIASAAALPLPIAQTSVHTLALAVGAAIDVTDTGTLAYRFPRDTRARLRQASFAASVRMTWQKVFPTLFKVVRVLFGVLLILSIVVTFVAIAALSSASRSDDERSDRRGGGGFMPVRLFAPDIFDVMFFTGRTRGYYNREQEQRKQGGMSFLEAVYSFVFGDGDPNVGLDDKKWRLVAATIRSNSGAVTAEQLAPYLDLPEGWESGEGVVDEGYVLPVLERFGGYPEVTEEGDIVYVFPGLGETGGRGGRVEVVGGLVKEQELELTRAAAGQKLMVGLLGVVNVFGVLTLGAKLAGIGMVRGEAASLIALIRGLYPGLVGYAGMFVIVPLVRWLRIGKENEGIKRRNMEREKAVMRLGRPDGELRRKLSGVEGFREGVRIVGDGNVVYSSDLEAADQTGVEDSMKDDFDRRLNR